MENAALEVEGSVGSVKGAARFRDTLSVDVALHLVIITMLGILIYLVVLQENDRERRYTATNLSMMQTLEEIKKAAIDHSVLLRNQVAIIGEIEGIPYVLTLTEPERKALKLQMPDSLRKKMNAR
jgi:hypothetical protein